MSRIATCLLLAAALGCQLAPVGNEPIPVGTASVTRFVDAGEACPNGGQRLEVGADTNGDGLLNDDEVQDSALLCDGAPGAPAASDLLRLTPVNDLGGCDAGGVRIELGRDADADLVLDPEEVRDTAEVCTGSAGGGGTDALVDVRDAAGCADGGQEIRTGLDANDNQVLDDAEVVTTRAICNGAVNSTSGGAGEDGVESLVSITDVGAGLECEAGGKRVAAGLDADGSGTLEQGEIAESTTVCNGVEGAVIDGGPGAGISEGASGGPVSVELAAINDIVGGHPGSVAARGTSFYSFTTRDDLGPAPYTLAFFGAESDLVVRVLEDDADGAEVPAVCTNEATRRLCATAYLQPDAEYFVEVRELQNIGNAFTLTISAGANDGSEATPSALALDTPRASNVLPLGVAHLEFTAPVGDHYTVSLENEVGLLGAPDLSFELLDLEDNGAVLNSCDAICPTRFLTGGRRYGVRVSEGAAAAATFDVRVTQGDALTPEVILDINTVDLSGPLQINVPAPGPYIILNTRDSFWVADDLDAEVPFFDCSGGFNASCIVEFDEARRYYLLPFFNNVGDAWWSAGGGNEGSFASPVPIQVGTPRRSSTAAGDDGEAFVFFPAESFYSFTTDAAAPTDVYTVRIVAEHSTRNGHQPRLFTDPLHADEIFTRFMDQPLNPEQVYVSEPIPPNTEVFLVIESLDASYFELQVDQGDTHNIILTPPQTTQLTVERFREQYLRFEVPPGGLNPVEINMTGEVGEVEFNVFEAAPLFTRLVTEFNDPVVDREVAVPGTIVYLEVTARDQTEVVDITVEVPVVRDLTFGVTETGTTLAPAETEWWRFETAVTGFPNVTIDSGSGNGNFRFYEPPLQLTVAGGWVGSVFSKDLRNNPTDPLAPGIYIFRVASTETVDDLNYTVTMTAP